MSADPHGTVIAPNAQPAPGGQTPPAAPSGWEATSLARQYGDPAKAEAAVIELRNYASKNHDRVTQLEAELAQIRSAVGGRPDPGATLSARQLLAQELALTDPRLINAAVQEAIAESFAPVMRANEALGQLKSTDTEFAKRADAVVQWANSNPAISSRFAALTQADPQGAFEWADAMYLREQLKTNAPQPTTVSQRNAAALPGGSGTGGAAPTQGSPQLLDLEKQGLEFGNQTGDMSAYRGARIAQTAGVGAYEAWLRTAGLIPG